MDTIKLITPEGATSASVDGQQYDVGPDGSVTVPTAAALQFYSFGFGNAPAAVPGNPAAVKGDPAKA